MSKLQKVIEKIICAPFQVRYSHDILLSDMLHESLWDIHYKLTILPQRVGLAWEKAATLFGWKQADDSVDLIDTKRKYAVELKNSAYSDNSSSRRRKYDALVEFGKRNPGYSLFYIIINDATAKDKMVHGNRIRYISSGKALKFLFQGKYKQVEKVMENAITKFINTAKLNVKCK
jgi:putative transposon-encoded protein